MEWQERTGLDLDGANGLGRDRSDMAGEEWHGSSWHCGERPSKDRRGRKGRARRDFAWSEWRGMAGAVSPGKALDVVAVRSQAFCGSLWQERLGNPRAGLVLTGNEMIGMAGKAK